MKLYCTNCEKEVEVAEQGLTLNCVECDNACYAETEKDVLPSQAK